MVPFSKQMSLPLSTCASTGLFNNVFEVAVIPNTSDEIRELVEEMVCKLEGIHSTTAEDDNLQKQFKSMTAKRETLPGVPGFELQCSIGRDFLRRHAKLLD